LEQSPNTPDGPKEAYKLCLLLIFILKV